MCDFFKVSEFVCLILYKNETKPQKSNSNAIHAELTIQGEVY